MSDSPGRPVAERVEAPGSRARQARGPPASVRHPRHSTHRLGSWPLHQRHFRMGNRRTSVVAPFTHTAQLCNQRLPNCMQKLFRSCGKCLAKLVEAQISVKKLSSQVKFSSVPAMRSRNVYLVGPHHHHHSGRSSLQELFIDMSGCRSNRLSRYKVSPDDLATIAALATSVGDSTGNRGAHAPSLLLVSASSLIELAAGLHMAFHRRSLYHALYGDTDVWLLGYFRRLTGTRLVATFHEPLPQLQMVRIFDRHRSKFRRGNSGLRVTTALFRMTLAVRAHIRPSSWC